MDKESLRKVILSVIIGGFLGYVVLRNLFGGGILGGVFGAVIGVGVAFLLSYILSLFPKAASFTADNILAVIFVALVLLGFMVAEEITLKTYIELLFEIVFRESFLLLSLIIPVVAGLGMNFGITVGVIAAQLSLILIRWFDIPGILGLAACAAVALPLAILFGWLTGKVYNRMRGIEMIGGLIVGYFAASVYRIILLYVVGGIIPLAAKGVDVLTRTQRNLLNPSGVGVRVSVDLGNLKYSLDGIWRMPFVTFVIIMAVCFLGWLIIRYWRKKKNPALGEANIRLTAIGAVACLFFLVISAWVLLTNNTTYMALRQAPIATVFVIALAAYAINLLLKTKLGRDLRSVGQDQHNAKTNGINVDRIRIIAVIISTVLAAWGMLIYLQNIGTLGTYTQHNQIGMFAVAAIMVGGATTSKASLKNVFIGIILFQSMFIFSPSLGKYLFGDPLYGENFRTFMIYIFIAIALSLDAYNTNKKKKTLEEAAPNLSKEEA